MWRRALVLLLAACLGSYCFALPASSSEPSVVLSTEQVLATVRALQTSQEALERSSDLIKQQSRTIRLLSICSCTLLVTDLAVTAVLAYNTFSRR